MIIESVKFARMLVTLDQNELGELFLRQRGTMEKQFTMYVRHQYFLQTYSTRR